MHWDGVGRANLDVEKENDPNLKLEVIMYNPKNNVIRIRLILTWAQRILGLVLLAFEIFEHIQRFF